MTVKSFLKNLYSRIQNLKRISYYRRSKDWIKRTSLQKTCPYQGCHPKKLGRAVLYKIYAVHILDHAHCIIDILMCPFLFCIWNAFKTKSCCKEGCQTTQLLRTGSYVIIVRAQFPYYNQSDGWAHLIYQSLEHVVRVCEKEPKFLTDIIRNIFKLEFSLFSSHKNTTLINTDYKRIP